MEFSAILFFVRSKTMTCCTKSKFFTASSTTSFNFTTEPLRYPPSAVIMIFDFESSTLSLSEDELNPEKTTVCVAPIRAQANIDIGNSGTIGR